ncbi:MAG: ABC transporter ATP-binding protein [Candidatus Dormibacteraeota bacterium]|uniref:ABC transporter ATP-binding protein n=1 Tax=Candidatus Dormiibacter inghamiae TaxID=3127013 RepID=A0A934KEE7_9BACT|nr:ABC transporter ATP-binding protein [Candidatus Dormibacteraeota bacterium]MBJ7605267.1 ABC transporter ATP-binding protein [Candidatus Dormibacteraeota bacterium]
MLLSVEHLTTEFATNRGVAKAVDDVSFELREGEALGVVGESGSGKSVTALSIMRLVARPAGRITSGCVRFNDENLLDLSEDEMRRVRGKQIAMIFQDPMSSLNPVLSIERQMTESLELHEGMTRRQARRRAIEMLELVGIPDAPNRVDDHPYQFSGGMRQRVMIAIALSCSPRLLIADEPTTALDVTIQAQITDLVQRLRSEFTTSIIWISHDLGVVAGLCDRALVMYAGQVIEDGTVDDIFADPRHPYTLGLLRSIPRLDRPVTAELVPIDGSPPDLVSPPVGCPFQPRCAYSVARSLEERPPLQEVLTGHKVACWVDITKAAG